MSSELIINHLNAMHAARKALIESEASEYLWGSTRIIYQPSDTIYYKRENLNMWKDLGAVIGCEYKQIIVKHRGTKIRVHKCQLQHAKDLKIESSKWKIRKC